MSRWRFASLILICAASTGAEACGRQCPRLNDGDICFDLGLLGHPHSAYLPSCVLEITVTATSTTSDPLDRTSLRGMTVLQAEAVVHGAWVWGQDAVRDCPLAPIEWIGFGGAFRAVSQNVPPNLSDFGPGTAWFVQAVSEEAAAKLVREQCAECQREPAVPRMGAVWTRHERAIDERDIVFDVMTRAQIRKGLDAGECPEDAVVDVECSSDVTCGCCLADSGSPPSWLVVGMMGLVGLLWVRFRAHTHGTARSALGLRMSP